MTTPLPRSDIPVWTCPVCTTTYRMPAGWEAAVFLAARRTAQVIHASRHGRRDALQQRRRRSSDPRPASELPAGWGDPDWAEPSPGRRREDPPPVQPHAAGHDHPETGH
jgi:hypothetical protein